MISLCAAFGLIWLIISPEYSFNKHKIRVNPHNPCHPRSNYNASDFDTDLDYPEIANSRNPEHASRTPNNATINKILVSF